MASNVKVTPIGDAFKLGPTQGEPIFDVKAGFGVVGQFVTTVLTQPQVLWADSVVDVPLETGLDPLIQPFLISAELHEELRFHLFELTGAEGEVAECYFVPK